MTLSGSVGFIGGGKMAEAMIKGILTSGLLTQSLIDVSDPDEQRRNYLQKEYGVNIHDDGTPLWEKCRIIILAVKPQIVPDLLDEYRLYVNSDHLVISIAAGVTLSTLEGKLAGSGSRIIRVMPNTPALVQEAVSVLSPGSRVSDADLALAKAIFNAIGKSIVLDEKHLDAVTGLSGSGPAYVFSFIEALIDAGVMMGLGRDVAEVLVCQTVLGSVKLMMESKVHPAQLRAMVTSPGGTTIHGLYQLEKAGFSGIIMDTVEAATKRSKELGGTTPAKEIR